MSKSKSELKFYLRLPLKKLIVYARHTNQQNYNLLLIEAPSRGLENKQAIQDTILLQNDI